MIIKNRIGRQYQAHDNPLLERHWGRENGPYQVRNMRYLRDLKPQARRVIDVGAHIGSNTIEYATWCKSVEAFEPTLETFDMLKHNVKWNQQNTPSGTYWDAQTQTYTHNPDKPNGWYRLDGEFATLEMTADITLYNRALGKTPGQARIQESNQGLANYIQLDKNGNIDIDTIDQYNWTDVDIIKVDVEGREWEVLQGARATIERCRPVVQVEMWQWERRFGINNQEMMDYFQALGYTHTNNRGEPLDWTAINRIPRTMDRFFVPRQDQDKCDEYRNTVFGITHLG